MNSFDYAPEPSSTFGGDRRMSWPGVATSCNAGSMRLEGPPTIQTTLDGTESPGGIYDLEGRLERLAFPSEEVLARGRAPLETYTTTTSEHGDIYRATPEFIEWLGSRIPGYGALDRIPRVSTRPAHKEMGGEPGLEVIDF